MKLQLGAEIFLNLTFFSDKVALCRLEYIYGPTTT